MSENRAQSSHVKNIAQNVWEKLAEKKIYFGHQSVGYNILDGVRDLMSENPLIKLEIVETHNAADFEGPLFAHSTIGRNAYPQSKIDAFTDVVENGIGEKTDVAFFKFCYLDFHNNTKIEELFEQYKESLSDLQKQFPEVAWVHSTVPLTSQQTGSKAWIKKMLGKPLRGYENNVKRNRFNEFLRGEYKDKEPLFDLANIESAFSDGKRASFTKDGTTYYSLVPDYTDDGSHLNEKGRKIVAEQFLLFLVNLVAGE